MAEFDSTLKDVSKDLQKVIDQLTKWSKLNDQIVSGTGKIAKGVQGDGKLGSGSQKMLDGALASFSGMSRADNRATRNFLENGLGAFSMSPRGASVGTAVVGNMGQIAGGVGSMMPDLGATFARASTYYGGLVAAGGSMSRGAFETRTQQLIGKGNQTGIGSDAQAAAYLSGRGMAPTSAAFGQTLKTVGGMAQLFNMSNVAAATAVEGLSSGAGSQNLLKNFGIYTSNPVTGQTVSPQQIISQIKGRLTAGRGKYTTEDVQESFRKGALGVSLQSLTPDQQSMVMTSLMGDATDSKTGPIDLNSQESMMGASKAMGGNPNAPAMTIFGAKNKAMQNAEGAYSTGAEAAAGALSALNDAAGALASTFLGMAHSAGGTFMGDSVGQGVGAVLGGVGNIAGTVVAGKMLGLGGGVGLTGALGGKAGGVVSKFLTGPGSKLRLGGLGATAAGAGMMMANGADAYNTGATAGAGGVDPGTAAMNILGGAASGALTGAGIGAMLAPFTGGISIGVGAGIGALVGGINSSVQMSQGAASTGAGGDTAPQSTSTVTSAGGKDQRQVGNNGRPTLIHPTSGPLGDKFGDFQDYRSQPHRGLDYQVNTGTLVWAAADGEVVAITGNQGQLGLQVKISHGGGYVTSYCHLSNNNFVKVGDKVKAKDKIGLSGNTGTATTGQHLHFAIEKNGQALDPLSFMGGAGAAAAGEGAANEGGGGAPSAEAGGSGMTDSTPIASAGSSAVNVGRSGISGTASSAATLLGSAGSSSGGSSVSSTGSGGEGVNGTSLIETSGAGQAIQGNAGSSGKTSSAKPNVVINLSLKNATDSEARKFAKRVKEYLDDERLLSNMGAF